MAGYDTLAVEKAPAYLSGAQVERVKVIPRAMGELDSAVSMLEKIAQVLGAKLEPVLHSGPPQGGVQVGRNAATPASTILADQIDGISTRLRLVAGQIEGLIDRLEV